MKTVLCYGDSLTWGYNPTDATRLPYEQRWPGILAAELAGRARVIEEGLNSRTIATDDPTRPSRNGLAMLTPILETHAPLDVVVLMLGTNDCSPAHRLTAADIGRGLAACVRTIGMSLTGSRPFAPKIVLVAPPPLGRLNDAMQVFYGGGEDLSLSLAGIYRSVADYYDCLFLDTATVAPASPIDGVHLDPPEQKKLALAVRDLIAPLL